MKKLPLFLFLLCITLSLRAQEEDTEDPGINRQFRFKNRTVELSIANTSVNVSNDFISAYNIFNNPFYIIWNIRDIIHDPVRIYKDPVKINLDDLKKGFNFNMNTTIKPLSLNFNWKDNWGVGLDIGHINVWGNFSIPVDVLTLKEATNKPLDAAGAVFADAGIPVFFHLNHLKIKFRPAVYVPLIYTRPAITYTYKKDFTNPETDANGSFFELEYDVRVYSLVDMQQDTNQSLTDKIWNISGKNLGYDFGLCVEYPPNDSLDIGVNFVNIPVPYAAGSLNHYTQLSGEAWVDTSKLDIMDLMDENNRNNLKGTVYDYDMTLHPPQTDNDGKKIYRPFTTLFYINYHPHNLYSLSIIPSLGFSINPLFLKSFGVEGGLSARLDLANIFITTLGVNYNDRIWKNSVDFILNLRAFEFAFGLSSQSPNFKKSWQGAGIGVNFGMKFGW